MGTREADLIAVVTGALGRPTPPPEGPGDDAAVVTHPATGRQVVTTDALIEGVHFLRGHPAEALGWKTLAVNLSDVAAMGARPSAFVLSAAVPRDLPPPWWEAFARGLAACARAHGAALVGGDTVGSPGPLMLSVTAWGFTASERVLTRGGGRPGDVLMVMGDLGRSALGLSRWLDAAPDAWSVDDTPDDPCLRAHLRPEPPIDAGAWALFEGATAGMDLSDGLATDLPRLAAASAVELVVALDALPDDPAVASLTADARVAGGEDYGLAVLVPPQRRARFEERGFVALGEARDPAGGAVAGVVWRLHGEPVSLVARPFDHFDQGPCPTGAPSS